MIALKTIDPKPKQGECVIWKHKGVRTKAGDEKEFPPKLGPWVRGIIRILMFAVYGGLFFVWFKNYQKDSLGFQDLNFANIGFLLVSLYVLLFLIKVIVKSLQNKQEIIPLGVIPLWLSEERLALAADGERKDLLIKTKDITSAIMDYSEGSPSIALKTSKLDYTLISSDRDKLINHLYTIRPDLMIAS